MITPVLLGGGELPGIICDSRSDASIRSHYGFGSPAPKSIMCVMGSGLEQVSVMWHYGGGFPRAAFLGAGIVQYPGPYKG